MSKNIEYLKEFVAESVELLQPDDTFSFIEGMEHAINAFAIWRDGDKLFGVREFTTKELAVAIKEYMAEQD